MLFFFRIQYPMIFILIMYCPKFRSSVCPICLFSGGWGGSPVHRTHLHQICVDFSIKVLLRVHVYIPGAMFINALKMSRSSRDWQWADIYRISLDYSAYVVAVQVTLRLSGRTPLLLELNSRYSAECFIRGIISWRLSYLIIGSK